MLEVLMTKNENNSHAFLRKMVENIKQTKDAQCPDDAKANEVYKLKKYNKPKMGIKKSNEGTDSIKNDNNPVGPTAQL